MEGERHKIAVGEHEFTTPPEPPKKEILFWDRPKAEQYWTRLTDFPPFFHAWNTEVEIDAPSTIWNGKTLISLSVEDTNTLISLRDREFDRIINGIWFMNNGIPTYITGGHYFSLEHGAMKGSKNDVEKRSIYGKYMKFQRNYCYFIEICKTTAHGNGGNVVKPKKTGITQLQALLMIADAITSRTSLFRIMSTSQDVAKDTNFGYIAYALEKLPPIITPSYRKNLGEVYFGNPDPSRQKSTSKKTEMEYLDTWIQTVATKENAFDSLTNAIAWVDEESKIEIPGGNVDGLHNTTLPTVKQGLERHGYIIYTHYVSEKNNDSFRRAKKIYYNCKLKTIDPATGKTKSELICYAMTVLDGVFGACDKYGEPDLKSIWAEINSKRAQKKNDPGALRAEMRQMPTCEDDMWQEMAGENSIFDNFRLSVKEKQIIEDNSTGILPYDFNFNWTIEPKIDEINRIYDFKGVPYIVPVTDDEKRKGKMAGLFKWYNKEWTPDVFLKKHVNNLSKDKKGRLMPRPDCPFYAVVDPTNYSNSRDVVTASKNAIQVFLLPTGELDGMIGKRISHKRLMVSYLHRADSPRDTLMHAVQCVLYFGCYVLIESNMSWMATKFKEWGLGNFLIVLNKDGVLEPYREFAEQKPFTSQKDTIGQYVTAGSQHLAPPATEFDIDHVDYLEDIDVIQQLMNFDPNNTRAFDAAVAYLIGQWGMDTFMGWRQREIDKQKRSTDGSMKQVMAGMVR